jgi:hypothetical protein
MRLLASYSTTLVYERLTYTIQSAGIIALELMEISLRGNEVGDKYFAEALKFNSDMQKIDLLGNNCIGLLRRSSLILC